MKAAITVRPADPTGRVGEALIHLLTAEMLARYPEVPDEGGGGYDPEIARSDPGATFLIAWQEGRPVGCGAVRPLTPGIGEVKRMFVAPEARRRGVAVQLLSALEAFARTFGYERLRLETGVRQPEALGLYERAGYSRIACYGAYADDPLSVCFEKHLPRR